MCCLCDSRKSKLRFVRRYGEELVGTITKVLKWAREKHKINLKDAAYRTLHELKAKRHAGGARSEAQASGTAAAVHHTPNISQQKQVRRLPAMACTSFSPIGMQPTSTFVVCCLLDQLPALLRPRVSVQGWVQVGPRQRQPPLSAYAALSMLLVVTVVAVRRQATAAVEAGAGAT